MMSQAPPARKPLGDRTRRKLLQLARGNSERFARALMAAAQTLDDGGACDALEYVDSLNGIDVYEDVSALASCGGAASRLRSLCHVDGDIHDVVRRLTTTVASGRSLPGIVETQELCSVLHSEDGGFHGRLSETEFPEQAGVNWMVLNQDSTRDSTSLGQSGVFTRRSSSLSSRSSGSGDDALAVELLVLAYQGIFKHRGRRGWVQWCQSIELANFPAAPHDAKRGVLFSSGIVAVESATRPGQVSLCYAMGLDLSGSDERERKFLESAVWRRVMKLAALKKAMLRESLSRTLSIASTATDPDPEPDRASSQSSRTVGSPTAVQQPESEPAAVARCGTHAKASCASREQAIREAVPVLKVPELRSESATHTPAPVDKRRQRAQTMQPTPSPHHVHQQSLFREPDSLEFRLSLYSDPDELPDGLPESPMVHKASKLMIGKSKKKSNRPKSRSISGWFL